MNYQETLNFLFQQLPMYQRVGPKAFKKDLNNIIALCKYLGNPEAEVRFVHIAGTNGKGSVTHMLKALCMQLGFKTGAYTSPHYIDFRERIKIDGELIPEQDVIEFVELIQPVLSTLKPSFFEITVAMSFWYFRKEQADIVILETGLGGRLDSTNVVDPLLSIITNISFDHTNFLGNTLELIASEKAGIIKSQRPVIIGRRQEELTKIFSQKAESCQTTVTYSDEILKVVHAAGKFSIESEYACFPSHVNLMSKADFQAENLQTALAAMYVLSKSLGVELSDDIVIEALHDFERKTLYLGRWQQLASNPRVIADSGHNLDGLGQSLQQLRHYEFENLRMVIGFVNDKDIQDILEILPRRAKYYFTQASVPRALDSKKLHEYSVKLGLEGNFYNSVEEAIRCAKRETKENDLIYIGGSIFVVAEALEHF